MSGSVISIPSTTLYLTLGGVPAHDKRMQEIIDNPALADPGEFDDSTAASSKRSKI
jgi:hypothetical protein